MEIISVNNSVFLQYSQHPTNKREKRNQWPIVRLFSEPNASLMSIMWIEKTKEKLWTSIERKKILIYRRQIAADCYLSADIHPAPLFCHQVVRTGVHCCFLERCVAIDTGPILKSPSLHTFPSQKEYWLSSNSVQKNAYIERNKIRIWLRVFLFQPPTSRLFS